MPLVLDNVDVVGGLPLGCGDPVVRLVVCVAGGQLGFGKLGLNAGLGDVGQPCGPGVVDMLELLGSAFEQLTEPGGLGRITEEPFTLAIAGC